MYPQILEQALDQLSTTKLHSLGTLYIDANDQGRRAYRYVAFPASTATAAGILLTAAAAPANSTGLALPTSNTTAQLSQGSKSLLVTNGATSVTQDQFAGGVLEVIGTNGNGQVYRIEGNTAAGNAGTITLTLRDALRNTTALANGTNTVNLRISPYSLPVAQTTIATPVGVTHMPIPSNAAVQYGWVQVGGDAFVNATSGTKGQNACQDIATNAGFLANSGASTTPSLGVFRESASGSMASVSLSIPTAV